MDGGEVDARMCVSFLVVLSDVWRLWTGWLRCWIVYRPEEMEISLFAGQGWGWHLFD